MEFSTSTSTVISLMGDILHGIAKVIVGTISLLALLLNGPLFHDNQSSSSTSTHAKNSAAPTEIPLFATSTFSTTTENINKAITIFNAINSLEQVQNKNTNPAPEKNRTTNLRSINPLLQFSEKYLPKSLSELTSTKPTTQNKQSTQPAAAPKKQASIFTAPTVPLPSVVYSSPITPSENLSGIRGSLINIFCTEKVGSATRIITGSGVLLNSSGLALTNAHVGQYLLIAPRRKAITGLSCIARTGSPASGSHTVDLVYLPSEWVNKNADNLHVAAPRETGEYDFALVKVGSLDSVTGKVSAFSGASIDTSSLVTISKPVVATSYPANAIATDGAKALLESKTEYLSLQDTYTFSGLASASGRPELIETSPSIIGQKGASGGAITDTNSNLLGIISIVVGAQSANGGQAIRAITTNYISSVLENNLNISLKNIASSGDSTIQNIARNFMTNVAPTLQNVLLGQ